MSNKLMRRSRCVVVLTSLAVSAVVLIDTASAFHLSPSPFSSRERIFPTIHAESSTSKSRVTPVSCENEMTEANNKTTAASSKKIPFPRSSYHLSKKEDNINYNFVSFIDHFDDSYTQVARLIEPRRYARSQQFYGTPSNSASPTIDDVACPPSLFGPVADMLSWNRLPARMIVGALAYCTFPIIIDLLESYTILDFEIQDIDYDLGFYERLRILTSVDSGSLVKIDQENRDHLATLVNLYLPGISIVLGTYYAMTLDILYQRYSRLQETAALEASMLAYCFQLLLNLFDKDRKNLIASTQNIADQIHVLVRDSRGKEIMRTIYNDPYANILRIVQNYSPGAASAKTQPQDASLVPVIRDVIRQLYELRTKRLNWEATGLAPAHFDLMTFLAGLLLVGIALGTGAYTILFRNQT